MTHTDSVTASIKQLFDAAKQAGVVDERREHQRRPGGLCVAIYPTDEKGDTIGRMIAGHCLDVSDGGIRFSIPEPLPSRFVRIEPASPAQAFGFRSAEVELLRHSAEDFCFVYAGRFIHGPLNKEV